MKKIFILLILFAFPVTIYIIFGSAVHNFVHLPILTENIGSFDEFEPLDHDIDLHFDGYATILCFYGGDIKHFRGNAFNLNEQIYKKNYIYKDFQIIVLAENGMEEQAQELRDELESFSGVNTAKWKFGFGSPEQLQSLFNHMKTDLELNKKKGSPYAFIIDKDGNLRGRKKNAKDTDDILYGYETGSIAALKNTMSDDVNVLLAEYRFALKKNEKDNQLKNQDAL